MHFRFVRISLLFIFLFVGCRPGLNQSEIAYKNTVANALATLPTIKKAAELFPTNRITIAYFYSSQHNPVLEFEAYLNGRYVLNLQSEIEIDRKRGIILKTKPFQIHMHEVKSLARLPTGQLSITYDHNWKISEEQFSEVLSKNSFSSASIAIVNQPVAGFAELYRDKGNSTYR